MPINSLTKALSAQKHTTFLQQLNLVDIIEKLGEKPGKKAPNDDNDLAYRSTDDSKHKQE
jgi:hypothetical protein